MSVDALGEELSGLRLCDAEALRQMQLSLARHGQLSPVFAFSIDNGLQVVDGFKRLRAARELGWKELSIAELTVADRAHAKAVMLVLNGSRAHRVLLASIRPRGLNATASR